MNIILCSGDQIQGQEIILVEGKSIDTMTTTEIRQYDVYSIQSRRDSHCWDGQLVVAKRHDGSLYLADTYWGSKHDLFQTGGDKKCYDSLEKAEADGKLKFICNLQDVEEINERQLPYYSEEDVFNLSYQHGCYKFFVKKKGALHSQSRMLEYAKHKLREAHNARESAERAIIRINDQIEKIESGDTSITIF